jgi:hypothetical protein
MDAPTCGACLTFPALDLASVARGCGWKWALGWGKPLANSGGHDIDDAAGAALLLEGDIEVVSSSSLTYLSRVKIQTFGLGSSGAPVSFPRWKRRLEIAGLVDDLGGGVHRLCLLLIAWSSVLWSCCGWWCCLWMAARCSKRLESFSTIADFQFPCMLKESCLPPTGAPPSDPGRERRELSSEVETYGTGSFSWPLQDDNGASPKW